eukprot:TRINITY_DN48296_c0_g1_i1.p1 TRINITY_DN48296_c0_g1~~TRINITY_DN48296_c0_g1_i1.p1  ORF type:complete len:137 (+),score=19.92 TRINITY_DN48296_c0_g1_i1:371-781(+)
MPWEDAVSEALETARAKGHQFTLTGHSLGGVQAAANYNVLAPHHRDLNLQVFNCSSGLGNIILGQLLPVDAIAQAALAAGDYGCRSTHHHILGDVCSSGTPLVAVTKTYRAQSNTKLNHSMANFIPPNRWSELNMS